MFPDLFYSDIEGCFLFLIMMMVMMFIDGTIYECCFDFCARVGKSQQACLWFTVSIWVIWKTE